MIIAQSPYLLLIVIKKRYFKYLTQRRNRIFPMEKRNIKHQWNRYFQVDKKYVKFIIDVLIFELYDMDKRIGER